MLIRLLPQRNVANIVFSDSLRTGTTTTTKTPEKDGFQWAQAAQTLFVIYIRDSIASRFEPFKRMYENGSKIALNSTCSKGFK